MAVCTEDTIGVNGGVIGDRRMTELKDFYESNVWSFHEVKNPYEKFHLRNILEFLAPQKNEMVLDVGSGGGSYARSIGEKSTVIAMDISRGAIKSARENMKQLETAFFIVSDVEQLPIREKSIDSVLCMDVIEHLLHLDRSIGEMSRVLKKSGKIAIFTTCVGNAFSLEYLLKPMLGRLLRMIYLKIGHLHAFSTAALLQLLGDEFLLARIQYMYPWIGSCLNLLWGVAHLKSSGTVASPRRSRDSISGSVLKAFWIFLTKENELFKNESIGGEIIINAIKR
jgi:ubiquinone/menaquinone biosynthesis C-methylase UbiE